MSLWFMLNKAKQKKLQNTNYSINISVTLMKLPSESDLHKRFQQIENKTKKLNK